MKIDNCFLCQRMFYELLSSCFHFNVIFVYVRGFPETGIHAITFRTEKIITLTSMPASNPWFAQYEFDTRQFFDRTCRRSTRETSPMSTNRNANKKQCDTVAYKKKHATYTSSYFKSGDIRHCSIPSRLNPVHLSPNRILCLRSLHNVCFTAMNPSIIHCF